MATIFRLTRSLLEGSAVRGVRLLVAFLLLYLAAWLVWFMVAELDQVELSTSARVEVAGAVHRVQSPEAGALVAVHVRLGEPVRHGQALIGLDAHHQEGELAEVEAHLAARRADAENLLSQLATDERMAAEQRDSAERERRHTRARIEAEEIRTRYAREESERVEQAAEVGLISELERHRYEGLAAERQAALEVAREEGHRLAADHKVGQREAAARRERLEQQLATARGEVAAIAERADALREEIEERILSAPVDGVVGALIDSPPGAWVEQGRTVAEIVPERGVRVVAFFPPRAGGRLRAGQPARFVSDARTELGRGWPARVERVATEPEARGLRVELELVGDAGAQGAPIHGTSGRVEAVVESISPAAWVLRTAGRRVGAS